MCLTYLAHLLVVVVPEVQVVRGGHFIPPVIIVVGIWAQKRVCEFVRSKTQLASQLRCLIDVGKSKCQILALMKAREGNFPWYLC